MNKNVLIEQLEDKLQLKKAIYSNEAVNFLIEKVGNPDSKIRDNLVCNIFGKAFFNNYKITAKDFLFWSHSFEYDLTNPIQFHRFSNVKSLMEDLYIKLDVRNGLIYSLI